MDENLINLFMYRLKFIINMNSIFQVISLFEAFIVSSFQLISIRGELCARGYWNIPDKISKTNLLAWFKGQMERIGLENVKDTLYFPQSSGKRELDSILVIK